MPVAEGSISDGYLACLVASVVFAVALLKCYPGALLKEAAGLEIGAAIYRALAVVLGALAVMFDLAKYTLRARLATPLSLALPIGLAAVWAGAAALSVLPGLQNLILALIAIRAAILLLQTGWLRGISAAIGGALIGYWAFLLSYIDGYKTPWIQEASILGKVHVDLLFASGIVNMLRSYHVGSLGVDGLSPFPYHFGSHRIVLVLSSLLGLQPLPFYSAIFPLIFCPLFLAAMFFFAHAFQQYLANHRSPHNEGVRGHDGWLWIVLPVLFVGVVPVDLQRSSGLWYNVFHSESFGAAMLFAYLPCVFFCERATLRTPIRARAYAGWVLIGALYLGELCELKISVALVMAATAGYYLLRAALPWPRRLLSLAATGIPVCYGLLLTRGNAPANTGPTLVQMIKPFAFLRDIVTPDLRLISAVAFFGPIVAFFLLRLPLLPGRSSFAECVKGFRARDFMDVELLAVCVCAAIAPGLILSVPQGATNFFAEVAYWVALPMLSVVLSQYVQSCLCGRIRPANGRSLGC